ncbi:MAG: hypothetical protein GX940_08455 [Clostridiaceae bacterium]|jgi:hypothetical protein|nr:hypothetical protein [Clostridiaceae bacterium]
MKNLRSISPAGLAVLSALAGIVLVIVLDEDSLDAVGNVFVGIGGILLIAAAQNDYIEELGRLKMQNEILDKQLEYLNKKNHRIK